MAGTPIATEAGPVAIEKLKVGDRVLTGTGDSRTEIVQEQWRKISVAMPNPEHPADTLWVDMLRSTQWVSTASCRVGGQVWIELEEIGYKGWAKVRAIEPCPEIAEGKGRVVTATLNHYNSYVYELKLAGTAQPLRPTDRHPIFSETRQEWIPAVELKPGELLKTASGAVELESITRMPGTHRVYNMEVEGDHRYFAGEAEVLCHNTCPAAALKGLSISAKWNLIAEKPAAWLKPYRLGGGHHMPAKSNFFITKPKSKVDTDFYNDSPCVPHDVLEAIEPGLHNKITKIQREGYDALRHAGKTPGWGDVRRIEMDALTKNGVHPKVAEIWVDEGIKDIWKRGGMLLQHPWARNQ